MNENFLDLKTIFDEEKITTTNLSDCYGKTLAQPLYADNQLIMSAGVTIGKDELSTLQFYLSEGSITEVCVTNQKRHYANEGRTPFSYMYTAIGPTGPHILFLKATSLAMAEQIGTDFCESVLDEPFSCEKVIRSNMRFIPIPEYYPEVDADNNPISRQYFQVVVSVKEQNADKPFLLRYLTFAKNTDEASEIIREHRSGAISVDMPEVEEEKVLKVTPVQLHYIVPEHFYKVYCEKEEEGVFRHGHCVVKV